MANTKPIGETEYNLFLFAIASGICFQFTFTVDFFLAPRFFALSLGLLVFVTFLLFSKRTIELEIDWVSMSFVAYFLFYLVSYYSAPCKSEVMFYTEKVFLCLLLFLFSSLIFKQKKDFLLKIGQLLSLISLVYFLVALTQLFELKSINPNSIYAISSLSGHKNLFACFLFLCVPFFINGLLITVRAWRFIFLFCLTCSVLFITLLQTRAVWLGLFVAVCLAVLFFLLKQKKRILSISIKKLLVSIAILFLFILVIILILNYYNNLSYFLSRLNISNFANSESGKERLVVWGKTLDLIKENFWWGVGAGNWQVCYTKFSINGISEALDGATFQRPHNDFLWILSETGIFGLITFLIHFCLPIFVALCNYVKEPFSAKNTSEMLIACFLIGFLVISFFDFPKERIELLVLSYLLLAYLYSLNVFHRNGKITIRLPILVLLISLVSFCVFTAFKRIEGEKYMVKIYKAKATKNPKAMIRYCEKVSSLFYEIDPASMPISWYKGIAFTQLNDYTNGCPEFEKAYQISKYNHIVNNNLGVCLLRNNHVTEAKKYFEESIRINPVYDEPKLNLVVIYFNERNYVKALQFAKAANPNLARTRKYLDLLMPLQSHKNKDY